MGSEKCFNAKKFFSLFFSGKGENSGVHTPKGPVRGHSLAHAWNLMTGGTRDVHNRVPSPQKPLEKV